MYAIRSYYDLKTEIMKTVISLIFLLLISSGISAQILNEVEVQPPEFLGVTNESYSSGLEIEDYIAERMQYPSVDMKFKNEGTEVILFTVRNNFV